MWKRWWLKVSFVVLLVPNKRVFRIPVNYVILSTNINVHTYSSAKRTKERKKERKNWSSSFRSYITSPLCNIGKPRSKNQWERERERESVRDPWSSTNSPTKLFFLLPFLKNKKNLYLLPPLTEGSWAEAPTTLHTILMCVVGWWWPPPAPRGWRIKGYGLFPAIIITKLLNK